MTLDIELPQDRRPEPRPNRRRTAVIAAGAGLVVAGAIGAVALSGHAAKHTKTSTAAPSTSSGPKATAPPATVHRKHGLIAPLTGLAADSRAAAKRCSVMVKIGNTAEARPQYGIDDADVVYEEVVDGGITRLAAVFQSKAPTQVGGLRSVRPTDHSLVQPLRGIFAYSGGNEIEVGSIQGAPALLLDETAAGPLMSRDYSRVAPNNLYAHVDQMYARCPSPAPTPLFSYRQAGKKPGGKPASTATIGFQSGYAVTWTWKPKSGEWKRARFGAPDVSGSGRQMAAQNVVVMSVPYPGGAQLADNAAALIGTGPLQVFTAGRVVKGTWSRTDPNRAARLLDAAGHIIKLTPGRTWVELPDPSYPVTSTP